MTVNHRGGRMLLKGFDNITTFFPPCRPGEAEIVAASAECTDDISTVFPYLNAVMKGTIYDPKNKTLHFKLGGHGITLHRKKIFVSGLEDREDAEKVLKHLKSVINRTYDKRHEIEPSYKTRAQLNVLGMYRLLPRTNCGKCGQPACMGFAAKLIAEETSIQKCAPLFTDEYADARKQLFAVLDEAGYPVPRV